MDTDLLIFIGVVLGVLAIPAIFSAAVDGRAPRVPIIVIVISASLILYAVYNKPGGYSIEELPEVFTRVVASIVRQF